LVEAKYVKNKLPYWSKAALESPSALGRESGLLPVAIVFLDQVAPLSLLYAVKSPTASPFATNVLEEANTLCFEESVDVGSTVIEGSA
jgi:hypothetical protein